MGCNGKMSKLRRKIITEHLINNNNNKTMVIK